MENSVLDKFERQFDALLRNYTRLKQDNAALRKKQEQLIAENNTLKEKHQSVVERIEKMIDRLKSISVKILEKMYHVKCPAEKAHELQEAAHFLDKKCAKFVISEASLAQIA